MRILNPSGQPDETGDSCRISSSPVWSYVYRPCTAQCDQRACEWKMGEDMHCTDIADSLAYYVEISLVCSTLK